MLLLQFLKHFEKCASLLTRDFQTPALLLEWCAICFFKPKKCAMAQKRLGNTELLCAMSFGKDFLNISRWAECFPYYLAEQAVSILLAFCVTSRPNYNRNGCRLFIWSKHH